MSSVVQFTTKLKRLIDGSIIAKNQASHSLECLETLLKIITNCKEFPREPKYRSIRGRGKVIQKVLKVEGGREVLFLVGFGKEIKEFEEFFILPMGGI